MPKRDRTGAAKARKELASYPKWLRQQNCSREEIRDLIAAYKASHPCIICGESDPACLDFDHRDRSAKIFCISVAVNATRNLDAVRKEIAKCDILCANCHRKKTRRERDYGRPKKILRVEVDISDW